MRILQEHEDIEAAVIVSDVPIYTGYLDRTLLQGLFYWNQADAMK